jgi:hypothetical protein
MVTAGRRRGGSGSGVAGVAGLPGLGGGNEEGWRVEAEAMVAVAWTGVASDARSVRPEVAARELAPARNCRSLAALFGVGEGANGRGDPGYL